MSRVEAMWRAADILESQLQFRNPLLINNLVREDIGKGLPEFVQAVNWIEVSGRVRQPNHPKGRHEAKRARYLVGYEVCGMKAHGEKSTSPG